MTSVRAAMIFAIRLATVLTPLFYLTDSHNYLVQGHYFDPLDKNSYQPALLKRNQYIFLQVSISRLNNEGD